MFAKPEFRTTVIRRLKNGDMVSLLDNEMETEKARERWPGWSLVSHSASGDPRWGAGERGWVETKYLRDCG